MGSYYYLEDPESDFGFFPIPEEEFVQALFSIASKNGLKITDKMILEEVEGKWKRSSLRAKKKAKNKTKKQNNPQL